MSLLAPSIEKILADVGPLLPLQGLLKDYIHDNNLRGFQNHPFHEAIEIAGDLYGACTHMPLPYYWDCYFKQKIISETELRHSLTNFALGKGESIQKILWAALFSFRDVRDWPSFRSVLRAEKISQKDAENCFQYLLRHLFEPVPYFLKIRHLYKKQLKVEWDDILNPVLFRLTSGFLDQGISLWQFPETHWPFFKAIGLLAQESMAPLGSFIDRKSFQKWFDLSPQQVIQELLHQLVGDSRYFEGYIKETLMAHAGWSGLVEHLHQKPQGLLRPRSIQLCEFVAIKLMLEWELVQHQRKSFLPLAKLIEKAPELLQDPESKEKWALGLALFFLSEKIPYQEIDIEELQFIQLRNLARIWNDALENTHYRAELNKLHRHHNQTPCHKPETTLQAIFCIDDRECSLRRHLEAVHPKIQTFSTPGFFGLDFFFQSLNDAEPVQLCPVQLTPQHVVKEVPASGQQRAFLDQKKSSQRKALSFLRLQEASGSMMFGFLAANTLGHLSLFKLLTGLFKPTRLLDTLLNRKIDIPTELALLRGDEQGKDGAFYSGFTYDEMALRVYNVLNQMGFKTNFTPLVILVAHGSSSSNNPQFAAYDCGACSGKPGAPNSRAFATMANLSEVRKRVAQKGIAIPDSTRFVGAYHDTCIDSVTYFDTQNLDPNQEALLASFEESMGQALGRNAQERCLRFDLAPKNVTPERALKEVAHRAAALFEPRPELGHARNSLCIIGRRSLTQGLSLDRRAFLNSYDPNEDPSGNILNVILNAAVPVCGGTNLAYYFGRLDGSVYGSGTKLSHNICGLLGVCNGVDDDLRQGLSVQMTELHDTIRLLIIVEQKPAVIESVIEKNAMVATWVRHEWIKLASIDPDTRQSFVYEPQKGFEPFPLILSSSLGVVHGP